MFCMFILVSLMLLITYTVESSNLITAIDSNRKNHSKIGVLSPGETITLYCPHASEIKWSLSDFNNSSDKNLTLRDNIQINNNQLKINSVSFKDSGVYNCEKEGTAYRFTLNIIAFTNISNGTVKMFTEKSISVNNSIYNLSKMVEKVGVNVSCNCSDGADKSKLNISWKRGLYDKVGDLYDIVTSSYKTVVTSTLVLRKPTNNFSLYGEYICSCGFLSDAMIDRKVYMQVLPLFINHPSSVRAKEGEDVVLNCTVWGYPNVSDSSIKWSYENTFSLNAKIKKSRNSSRPGFSQLFIPNVTSEDRGIYTCHASNSVGSNFASTELRVKGRYAALWPFLGIVIQLIILIAIIVIHERRKSQQSKNEPTKLNVDARNEQDAICSNRGNEPESVRQRLVKV